MAATRKTRGPRTPHERACDAARSAATLLERTDDDELHAVATMLRFEHEHDWLEPGRVEAAANARRLLVGEWSFVDNLLRPEKLVEIADDLLVQVERFAAIVSPSPPKLELIEGGDGA